CQHGFGIPVTF
nr:immunoglobulin light chain junction region [Macaca mulatta]MPN90985.1 immunoglobulin light chain junction region [Macaca mulatta]MPN91124.1 immunoglobulin light chain junction region [Macaca mulatta]MPN91141.1 immunoglobulin light chain junction region [Macaca mulatta]MPN91410.1 immunoglobulin light chain junction region [Macaca mulatta]